MQADPQVDAPLIVASLSILLILASSLVLWIRHIQKPESIIEQDPGTPAWPVGWVNFGIFVCAMIIFVYVAQVAASLLFFEAPAEGEGTTDAFSCLCWLFSMEPVVSTLASMQAD